jgi:hypothetical protein
VEGHPPQEYHSPDYNQVLALVQMQQQLLTPLHLSKLLLPLLLLLPLPLQQLAPPQHPHQSQMLA